MNRFIIALDRGNREQRNAVTAFLQAKGWQVWHHMEDLWLLADVPDGVSSKELADEIESISLIGDHTKFVVKIEGNPRITHWGRANKEGWIWMKEFWGSPA